MPFYNLIRNILFRLQPEVAHTVTLKSMQLLTIPLLAAYMRKKVPDQPVELMGLTFPNRVGLAAGLDKNADYIDALGALGFGFIEVGTLTPKPQPGNDKPRLFRLPEQQAIINRMGFNNKGIQHAIQKIDKRKYSGVVGVNIGKNKLTENDKAIDDYLSCLRQAYSVADYITINVSSPNTPGLRSLQFGEDLKNLLASLDSERTQLSTQYRRRVPLVLKIAPDIDEPELDTIAEYVLQFHIDGIIVSNTTISRPDMSSITNAAEAGGLSGRPLRRLSTIILKQMHNRVGDKIPLIGVGGINSADDALEKLEAGASLVQIYTGLIYQGPDLIQQIGKAFKKHFQD